MKYENLGLQLFELQKVSNKYDQYTRRNNLEIHGIPAEVKFVDIFSQIFSLKHQCF